jgi:hypothetical protein
VGRDVNTPDEPAPSTRLRCRLVFVPPSLLGWTVCPSPGTLSTLTRQLDSRMFWWPMTPFSWWRRDGADLAATITQHLETIRGSPA